MDWNQVEGNWKQVRGSVREKWGRLTDDDRTIVNGRRDQIEGRILELYNLTKDQMRRDIDGWYGRQKSRPRVRP